MILISGYSATALASFSADLSVLPSSTKMISKSRPSRLSTDMRELTNGAMLSSSLKTGTMTDNWITAPEADRFSIGTTQLKDAEEMQSTSPEKFHPLARKCPTRVQVGAT